METGLDGKGVLVTGGAGGIGAAVVSAFASEGALVAVHYLSSETRATELAARHNGAALQADLTDEHQADSLIPATVEALGRLDVVVANAGAWAPAEEPLWDMTFERWRSTLAACLDSVFLTCRAFLRHVKETKSGNIVIVASTAGVIGEAGYADYAAAKGALVSGFVKSLKNEIVEIAPRGRVNVVAPGWTAVERTSDRLEDVAFVDKITRTMALRKVARPEDVARVVVALASDEISGHVTGEVVAVAGGIEGRVLHD
ncbi:MAG: 3-oxoacyl-[acyl-carrier protein] reductase [Actinomycetota bacterium]|nr:3-oxoacyl-[acyl-carrier protein] reductase [Actinomycetota bacterium]